MTDWDQVFTGPAGVRLYVIHTGSVHMAGNIHFNKKARPSKPSPGTQGLIRCTPF